MLQGTLYFSLGGKVASIGQGEQSRQKQPTTWLYMALPAGVHNAYSRKSVSSALVTW